MGNRSDREKNWHAVNLITGEECGHAHHSKETARKCAGVKGWTHAKICTFWNCSQKEETHKRLHKGAKEVRGRLSYNRKIGKRLTSNVSEAELGNMNIGKDQEEER